MDIQALVPKASVERLDERIVRRLSGTRQLQGHAVGIGPQIDQAAVEITPVAHPNVAKHAQFPT